VTKPRLEDLPKYPKVSDDEYDSRLKDLQKRVLKTVLDLRSRGVPTVIAVEGMDAAGKGGSILRLVSYLDPRFYQVWPIAAPSDGEQREHYLERFWNRLPSKGEIAVFDRTWYGRVLVERVEGFAAERRWRQAYEEINNFEQLLVNDGMIVMKFWFHVSADEQLQRFEERAKDPLKSWKLTPDDWRNRDKRPAYIEAAEEMFAKTDTEAVPWQIINGEHKHEARLAFIEAVLEGMRGH
jgi:polyphosphate kinase 2 (PPK2 family)